jgi:thiol-disulfide isomerase/thioredoxin
MALASATIFLGMFIPVAIPCTALAVVTAPGVEFPRMETTHLTSGKKVPVARPGTVTMVNLWATWCEACKVEIAEMEKALLPITGVGGSKPDLKFVSLDKEPAKASEWFNKNTSAKEAMAANLYSDAGFELAEKLEADSFPMTILVGKDGKILHVEKGYKTGAEGEAQVRKIAELMKAGLN